MILGQEILAAYGVRHEFVGVDQENTGTIKIGGRGTLTRLQLACVQLARTCNL
jgi:hypothetical protein